VFECDAAVVRLFFGDAGVGVGVGIGASASVALIVVYVFVVVKSVSFGVQRKAAIFEVPALCKLERRIHFLSVHKIILKYQHLSVHKIILKHQLYHLRPPK
jgi:hypothetical protein